MAEQHITVQETARVWNEPARSSACWDVLGRGSAAGRALFNVYDGARSAKQYGQSARERNALAAARVPAAAPPPPPPATTPPSKARVAVPTFRRSAAETAPPAVPPRRKPQCVIAQEAEADARAMAPPPPPQRPPLDEREKERCAVLMEHRGKPPALSAAALATLERRRAPPRPRRRDEELQELFDGVRREIEEREAFAAQMRAAGRPLRHFEHVRLEIATRLKELERLDALLRAEQAAAS